MAGENTLLTLDGLFKRVFSKKLAEPIPDWFWLQSRIKFAEEAMIGEEYQKTVVLGLEHGFTYRAASSGSTNNSIFTLNGYVNGITAPARLRGSQFVLQSAIGYEPAFAAPEAGEKAFRNATAHLVANMQQSARRRLEIAALYGQQDLGLVESYTNASNDSIVVTAPTWAPGIWAGMEGAVLEFFDTAGTTKRTTGVAEATILSVDPDTRTITFSGAAPTDIVATDRIFFKSEHHQTGPVEHNFAGIHKITTNTGTLFGISASTYNLWKSVIVSAGSLDLDFDTCLKAHAAALCKGGLGKYVLLVSPRTWANLMSDQAALRRYDKSDSPVRYEVGAKSITFYSMQSELEIVAHPCVKEGFAYGLLLDEWHRIGVTDVTFNRAKMGGSVSREDSFFLELATATGFELRCYSNQAFFCEAPGHQFVINNIVNS